MAKTQNKPLNRSLHAAEATSQDEFYTQLSDIENELKQHMRHFKGNTVLRNCDDPRGSDFFHYCIHNSEKRELERLITTCYKNQNVDMFSTHRCDRGVKLIYEGNSDGDRISDREEIAVRDPFGQLPNFVSRQISRR